MVTAVQNQYPIELHMASKVIEAAQSNTNPMMTQLMDNMLFNTGNNNQYPIELHMASKVNEAAQSSSNDSSSMMMALLSFILSQMGIKEASPDEDTVYAKVDKNGDIDYDNAFERANKSLGTLDTNEDGKIDLDEAGPGADMYDLDGNGKITIDEDVALSLYQDKDGDGIITQEEYEDFFDTDKDEAVEGLEEKHALIADEYEEWKS